MSELSSILKNIGWENIYLAFIDIIIISLLIYGFLRALKGTRSRHIFLGGMLLLVILQIIVKQWHPKILSKLLNDFYNHLVLIFIIIFQSDIRKALAPIGNLVDNMRKENKTLETDYLSEITEAIGRLSLHKIGTLIVIERDDIITKLPEVMGGYTIGAPVNHHLLIAIFQPTSSNSIHDGAVIIRGSKLIKAGVMLPLTKTPLPEYFGSRHKAALGITDISDAISLVVSEERGTITICESGILTEMHSVEELKAYLATILQRSMHSSYIKSSQEKK